MKLFYTNSSAKAEIADLESKISTLEANSISDAAEIVKLTEELKTANESVASLTTERDEAIAAFEASEKTAADESAANATAQAKLSTFDAEVETAVQAKFASLGGPPIPSGVKDETQSKPDISGLSGHAKVSAFFKSKEK